MTKSKLFFALLLVCLISSAHAESKKQKHVKINQLKASINMMFAPFLSQHPELEQNKSKIISNLDAYGYQLSDNQINQYISKVKEIMQYTNYMHLAYNYSVFDRLEQLSK